MHLALFLHPHSNSHVIPDKELATASVLNPTVFIWKFRAFQQKIVFGELASGSGLLGLRTAFTFLSVPASFLFCPKCWGEMLAYQSGGWDKWPNYFSVASMFLCRGQSLQFKSQLLLCMSFSFNTRGLWYLLHRGSGCNGYHSDWISVVLSQIVRVSAKNSVAALSGIRHP